MKRRVWASYLCMAISIVSIAILLKMSYLDLTEDDFVFALTTQGKAFIWVMFSFIIAGQILITSTYGGKKNLIYLGIITAIELIVEVKNSDSSFVVLGLGLVWEVLVIIITLFKNLRKNQQNSSTGYENYWSNNRTISKSFNSVEGGTTEDDSNDNQQGNEQQRTKIYNPTGRTRPVGEYSDGSAKAKKIYYVAMVATAIIYILLAYKFGFILFIPFLGILIAESVIFILSNPLVKLTRQFHKDIDVNRYVSTLEDWKKNNNLHPDTYYYLTALQANVMALEDLNKNNEMFASSLPPSNPTLRTHYLIMRYSFCLYTGLDDEASSIRLSFTNKKIAAMLDNATKLIKTKENMDILTIYPTTTKNRYLNLINSVNIMYYYYTRNYIDDCKNYANRILDMNTSCTYINDVCRRLINDEEVNDIFAVSMPI